MEVSEDDKQYQICLDLPGMSKEDVNIEIQDNALIVSGERKQEKDETRKGRQYTERFYGSFWRSFTLPSNVKAEQVMAEYNNGVLEISIPKAELSQPRRVEIAGAKKGHEKVSQQGTSETKKSA
jgi:HSP20 family protein